MKTLLMLLLLLAVPLAIASPVVDEPIDAPDTVSVEATADPLSLPELALEQAGHAAVSEARVLAIEPGSASDFDATPAIDLDLPRHADHLSSAPADDAFVCDRKLTDAEESANVILYGECVHPAEVPDQRQSTSERDGRRRRAPPIRGAREVRS